MPQRVKGGAFLGEGAFGCIYESSDVNPTSTIVTINVDTTPMCAKVFFDQESFNEELASVKNVLGNHLIPNYYGYATSVDVNNEVNCTKIQKGMQPYGAIYMQKLDYSLEDVIQQKVAVTEIFTKSIQQFVDGLASFHNTFLHCDIKPQNIMYYTNQHKWYLVDFGMVQNIKKLPKTFGGTPFYSSPLTYMHNAGDGPKGIKAYQSLTSKAKSLRDLTSEFGNIISTKTNGGTFYDYLQELQQQYEKSESDLYKNVDNYSMALIIQQLSSLNLLNKDTADTLIVQLLGADTFENIKTAQSQLNNYEEYGSAQQYLMVSMKELPFPM